MSETPTSSPTPERIFQLAWGYTAPLIVEAAIRNKVFDTLDSGPMTLAEVSAATGASIRGLRAIMNALVGMELLSKSNAEQYCLTPESSLFLVTTKPSFAGGVIRHTSSQLIPKWLDINEVVRTGKPSAAVNQEGEGTEFFHEFVEDIFPMSYPAATALAKLMGISDATDKLSVLDLATGSGVWSIALAQASPQVHVTAVDWPGVLDVTKRVTARFGLSDRYKFVAGDLLEADFGVGHDIATLGHILHSEGVERSKKLLQKVYDSLAPGGQIVIAEMVPDADRKGPLFPLLFAVNMMINTENGDTYSYDEMTSWLSEVGFVNAHTLGTPGPSPLLLATKPD